MVSVKSQIQNDTAQLKLARQHQQERNIKSYEKALHSQMDS